MNKSKVDVTICKILNCKPVVMWGRWKNVDCSDDTLNKTKFKVPLPRSLKLNITSKHISGLSCEGLDDCYPKCPVINRDGEECTHFSKEEA